MAPEAPWSTDPSAVVTAMESAGWVQVGGRSGEYARLRLPGERTSTVVPLDPDFADYPNLMGAILGDLRAMAEEGARAQRALDFLAERPKSGEPHV